MAEHGTIEPEYEEIKKEYEVKINEIESENPIPSTITNKITQNSAINNSTIINLNNEIKENTVFYFVVEYSLSWNISKYSKTMFSNILTFLIYYISLCPGFHFFLDWPKFKTM